MANPNQFSIIKSWIPISQVESTKRALPVEQLKEIWAKLDVSQAEELIILPADAKVKEPHFSHFEAFRNGKGFIALEQNATYNVKLSPTGVEEAKPTLEQLQPVGLPKNFFNLKQQKGKQIVFPYDNPIQIYNKGQILKLGLADKVKVDLMDNTIFRPSRNVAIWRNWVYFLTYFTERAASKLVKVDISTAGCTNLRRVELAEGVEDFFVDKHSQVCALTTKGEVKYVGSKKGGKLNLPVEDEAKCTTIAHHKKYVLASSSQIQKGVLTYYFMTTNPLKYHDRKVINTTAKWTMICPSISFFERPSGTYALCTRFTGYIDLFCFSKLKIVDVLVSKKVVEEAKVIFTSTLLKNEAGLDLILSVQGKALRVKINGL